MPEKDTTLRIIIEEDGEVKYEMKICGMEKIASILKNAGISDHEIEKILVFK